jgi:nucleotide-binding universal stress UspA family protein
MIMITSILVGLDGSPCCAAAVELGLRWARETGARLTGLGIIDAPTICKPEPVPLGASGFKKQRDEALLADARRKVEEFLDQFARRCRDVGVACEVLEVTGLPWEQVVREGQRYDLILLGRETHFHFETQDQGDETLYKVLKNSPCPVVAVPEKLEGDGPVVVAHDGSLQAARALHAFQATGLGQNREVHIVSVAEGAQEATRRAESAAEFLRSHGVSPAVHALATSAPAAQVILEQVRRLNAGLVVMGAYGQPAWREFFLGSVTRTLLKESPVPLFLFH